jgi:tRNA-2-methylthio-N6-dimethylallyladenosine synthase
MTKTESMELNDQVTDSAGAPVSPATVSPAPVSPTTVSPASEAGRKRVHIRTYGCQMNVYDSERINDVMAPLGYDKSDSLSDADMVILNTCHIREKAAEKVFSELGRLRDEKNLRKSNGGDLTIAVAGCVAQAEGAEIRRRAPYVDLVMGPQTYHRLPQHMAALKSGKKALIDTDFPVEAKFGHMPKARLDKNVAAFLTVQEGCDKFCAFCVVPYTRGAEYSRTAGDILAEARILVAGGSREITLLGQNVNAYHGAGDDGTVWSLARLIRTLAEIDGLERIRFTTSHPNDMDPDLIAAHGDCSKLMPYLHLPVQSGSDKILAAMNRKYSAEDYLQQIGQLRAVRPDLALSGDFIVGFPGETEGDFQATLDLVAKVNYAQAYSFKYSPRPGTPAAGEEQVAEAVKAERLARLQALLNEQQRAFNEGTVGRTLPVLFDRQGKFPGQLVGRSPYMQAVHVALDDSAMGQIIDVKITAAGANSLQGEVGEMLNQQKNNAV